jgi:hypothetical protein
MIGYVTTWHKGGSPFFEEPKVPVEPQSPDESAWQQQ